jgi:hypothetical protein
MLPRVVRATDRGSRRSGPSGVRLGIRLVSRSDCRRIFLDARMRPVSLLRSVEPDGVPDNEINIHLGNPG